jgi:hypothetical protein
VFSVGFDVTVNVANATASDIVIDAVQLIVHDAGGNSLTQEFGRCTAAGGAGVAADQLSGVFVLRRRQGLGARIGHLVSRSIAMADAPVTNTPPLDGTYS